MTTNEIQTIKFIKLEDYPRLKLAYGFVSEIDRAVIAGGVARDILLNGKVSDGSDIDIFIGQSDECGRQHIGRER